MRIYVHIPSVAIIVFGAAAANMFYGWVQEVEQVECEPVNDIYRGTCHRVRTLSLESYTVFCVASIVCVCVPGGVWWVYSFYTRRRGWVP